VLVGVLALQGDFREHAAMLRRLGAAVREVRTPAQLDGPDALVIPGGESTAIARLAANQGLIDPLRAAIGQGMPVLGTCAGMIFLAADTTGFDQPQLGVLDVVVERNAFGRQVASFEEELTIDGIAGGPMRAVYIRAPWVAKIGAGVDVLAESHGHPVMVRQDRILATAFHPELTDDGRIHRMLLDLAGED
jgi:5'-phosphate synthase pdxT subunit